MSYLEARKNEKPLKKITENISEYTQKKLPLISVNHFVTSMFRNQLVKQILKGNLESYSIS